MIESDSISVSDAGKEEDHAPMRLRGACCGGHDADDQAGADGGAALDGERVEQCVDGATASRTTAPGS